MICYVGKGNGNELDVGVGTEEVGDLVKGASDGWGGCVNAVVEDESNSKGRLELEIHPWEGDDGTIVVPGVGLHCGRHKEGDIAEGCRHGTGR